LPHRSLTEGERARVQQRLDDAYDRFVQQAASARGIPEVELRELAAGRIYSGMDAREVGLVDELGSLSFAIDLAARQAGLAATDKISLIESPRPSLSSWRDLRYLIELEGGGPSALFDASVYRQRYLDFLVSQRGQPMVLLPYDYFEGSLP
jgi:protease-4